MLQMAGWSEANTGSTLGARDRRPSRLSEMPLKRPRMKSAYEFISQVAVPLANARGARAAASARAAKQRNSTTVLATAGNPVAQALLPAGSRLISTRSFAHPPCAGMSAGAADSESAPRLLRDRAIIP